MLAGLALVCLACGDDDDDSLAAPTTEAPAGVSRPAPTTIAVEPGTLPFDLGPGIVAGGDDVIAAGGLEVPAGRFVTEIATPPAAATAEAYRLVPDPDDEERVRAAAAAMLGDTVADVDFHVDGGRFEFHAEGHGHDSVPVTTIPPSGGERSRGEGSGVEPRDAVAALVRFVAEAGLGPTAGEPATFESGGFLSAEVGLQLVPGAPVTRAEVSVTFDSAGEPIGGFGPIGRPESWGSFDLVGLDAAVRRLELTDALTGYPTTTSAAPGPPVALVSAELVHSRREVVTADGRPTGDTWLVPSWRFTDEAGGTREVIAVVADALQLG